MSKVKEKSAYCLWDVNNSEMIIEDVSLERIKSYLDTIDADDLEQMELEVLLHSYSVEIIRGAVTTKLVPVE